jgi:hypothetical protein
MAINLCELNKIGMISIFMGIHQVLEESSHLSVIRRRSALLSKGYQYLGHKVDCSLTAALREDSSRSTSRRRPATLTTFKEVFHAPIRKVGPLHAQDDTLRECPLEQSPDVLVV